MEYRNIDNDYNLYHHTKRFYKKELTEVQLRWILKDQNYSPKEISSAIEDYYLIHVRSSKLVIVMIVILFLLFLIFLPLLYVIRMR